MAAISIRCCWSIPTWVRGCHHHLVRVFWFLAQANMLPHAQSPGHHVFSCAALTPYLFCLKDFWFPKFFFLFLSNF